MKPTEDHLTPQQQAMVEVWERHMRAEFVEHSADAAFATMSAKARAAGTAFQTRERESRTGSTSRAAPVASRVWPRNWRR